MNGSETLGASETRVADFESASTRRDAVPPPHKTFLTRVCRLSVIMPFYNEAANAAKTAAAVVEHAALNPRRQFILADDGSTDETARILAEIVDTADVAGVEVVHFPVNQGKGRTIKSALDRCTGDAVCFIDGDLAYSLDYLNNIEDSLSEHEIVIGSRTAAGDRSDRGARRLYGSTFNWIVRKSLGLPYRDTQAGLKGFRREVADRLFGLQRLEGFGFDVELLFLARKFGYAVAEIPARVRPDHTYKASFRRLFVDSGEALYEVMRIRHNDRRGLYSL
jgi:glycosyltransferase involved in cell wall biosynthesis